MIGFWFWSILDGMTHFLTPQNRGIGFICNRYDKGLE